MDIGLGGMSAELTRAESLDLVATSVAGRLVLFRDGTPAIVPVRVVAADRDIVVEPLLDDAIPAPDGALALLSVEQIAEDSCIGWYVEVGGLLWPAGSRRLTISMEFVRGQRIVPMVAGSRARHVRRSPGASVPRHAAAGSCGHRSAPGSASGRTIA